jgi:hypothetical protein
MSDHTHEADHNSIYLRVPIGEHPACPGTNHVRNDLLQQGRPCRACGERGADVRPDFNWNRMPVR